MFNREPCGKRISSHALFNYLYSMNSEEIEKFLNTKTVKGDGYVKIDFKKRDTIYGLFVKDNDYGDLKSKNFWRIVTRTHFDEYNKSKNISLAKIFNGAEFSRLSLLTEGF
jgi:hypothetical protein